MGETCPGQAGGEAAGRVVRRGWPHYFYGKVIVLMETPKLISKRLKKLTTNSGFDE